MRSRCQNHRARSPRPWHAGRQSGARPLGVTHQGLLCQLDRQTLRRQARGAERGAYQANQIAAVEPARRHVDRHAQWQRPGRRGDAGLMQHHRVQFGDVSTGLGPGRSPVAAPDHGLVASSATTPRNHRDCWHAPGNMAASATTAWHSRSPAAMPHQDVRARPTGPLPHRRRRRRPVGRLVCPNTARRQQPSRLSCQSVPWSDASATPMRGANRHCAAGQYHVG